MKYLYNLCFLFDYIGVVFFVFRLLVYFVLSVCDWIDMIINLFNVFIYRIEWKDEGVFIWYN